MHDSKISVVTTSELVSYDYTRYAPLLNDRFGDASFIGVVNWHEGANAPNAILAVQTIGDLADWDVQPG
ncbi:hypothetical protein ABIF86_000244 [Bradyrhizobium japonicum]